MRTQAVILTLVSILSFVTLSVLFIKFDPYESSLGVMTLVFISLFLFLTSLVAAISIIFSKNLTVSLRRGLYISIIAIIFIWFKRLNIINNDIYYLIIPISVLVIETFFYFRQALIESRSVDDSN